MVDAPLVDFTIDRIRVAVLAAVGETEPGRVPPAWAGSVDQFRDEREGADRLGAYTRLTEKCLEVLGLTFVCL